MAFETERPHIEFKSDKFPGVGELEFKLFFELAVERRQLVFAGFNAASECAPMSGIPDVRHVIAQLQEVTAVRVNQYRCCSIADVKGGSGFIMGRLKPPQYLLNAKQGGRSLEGLLRGGG